MKKNWSMDDMPDQAGKTVLITGANDGLGYHLTRAFARKNASRVIMACRNLAKAENVQSEITHQDPHSKLDILPLDLGDLQSVKAFSERVIAGYSRLDVLFCNGGIMAVPYGKTKDGLELHMGVNYYGHFAMVGCLMPLIKKTPGARVVTTSSSGEKFTTRNFPNPPSERGYMRWFAYGDSKLAVLMLGLMLDEKFKREGIDAKALSAHPGLARTHLRTSRLDAEKDPLMRLQLRVFESISMPAERGILPLLYAATAPEVQGGEYIGVSGIGEIQGNPKITQGQRKAYDPRLRKQLWELSERVTGVSF